jgi:PucR family transcriptional regulator, purine catabolism regulatory protein
MAVDLHWLLGQKDLGLRLRTGSSRDVGLDWAHSIDLLDPTPWLTGHGLVLTTGLRLPRSAREHRAYAGRLSDAGVAALGFGVGLRCTRSRPGWTRSSDSPGSAWAPPRAGSC